MHLILSPVRIRSLACLLAGLVIAGCIAASPGVMATTEGPREAMPEHLKERLSGISVVAGDYRQKKELADLDHTLTSKGHFVFWAGHGLYLQTDSPFFSATTITPRKTIYWNEKGKPESDPDNTSLVQREINKTLLAFFNVDVGVIKERFSLNWTQSGSGWHLRLVPTKTSISRQIRSVALTGTDYVKSISVETARGDHTRLRFSNVRHREEPTRQQCGYFIIDDPERTCGSFNQGRP